MINIKREASKYGHCSSCDTEKIEFRVEIGTDKHTNVERLCTNCLRQLKRKIGWFIY